MKDESFKSNERLFKEVEEVRKKIREEIYNKCRNGGGDVPAAKLTTIR
jgi:hypothetical protein